MPDLTGKNLIACDPSALGPERFRAVSPADGRTLPPDFRVATEVEVDLACVEAEAAGRQWATEPWEIRADLLEAIAGQIEALGDELLERANAETALPLQRLASERGRTCGQLRMFATHVRSGAWLRTSVDLAEPERTPLPKPDLRRTHLSLGPVAVFGASNFPLAFSVAGGDTASALAAGCPVVVKAHEAHPGTSELVGAAMVEAIKAVGAPPGLFSLLFGGPEVGRMLVVHPAIRAVGFTGSQRAGRALFDLGASRPRPIPVFAEMGSVNPVFALPGALEERSEEWAKGYAGSLTLGVGQFCTNPGVLVGLMGEGLNAFVEQVGEALAEVPEGVMLTEGICRSFRTTTEKLAHRHGVGVAFRSEARGAGATAPALFTTTADEFLNQPDLRDEVFGPAGLVVACVDFAEMVRVALALEGQLTATVLMGAGDDARAKALLPYAALIAGRVIVNGFPTGVEVCASMQHGGPYPATTDARFTSVGTAAMDRFLRPVAFQNVPEDLLPG